MGEIMLTTEDQKLEILEALSCKDGTFNLRRVQVIQWRFEGVPTKEIVLRSGYNISHVSNIYRKYLEYGLDSLRSKIHNRIRRHLSIEAESLALNQIAEKTASTEYLLIEDIKAEFEQITGKFYSPYAFFGLLHRHGWLGDKPWGRYWKKPSK